MEWTLAENQLIEAIVLRICLGHHPQPCVQGTCELCDSVRTITERIDWEGGKREALNNEMANRLERVMDSWIETS